MRRNYGISVKRSWFDDFSELAAWILKERKHPKLFATVVWSIWQQWNQVRLRQSGCALHQIPQMSKDRVEEFLAVQIPQIPPRVPHRCCWSPPPPGFVKINVNGAVFSDTNSVGVSTVIRNREGLVMASQT